MPQLQINQGPQDALLYDNTRSYFTNVGYVRTSNFQVEYRDISPQNTAHLGTTVQFVIPKAADLLGPVDLMIDLQACNNNVKASGALSGGARSFSQWVDELGFAMLEKVTFSVGSNDIETITGEQMQIKNELMTSDEQRLGYPHVLKTGRPAFQTSSKFAPNPGETPGSYDEAIAGGATAADVKVKAANIDYTRLISYCADADDQCKGTGDSAVAGDTSITAPGRHLIIPLNLFFTQHVSKYFPLAAVAGCNDVRISVKFRPLNELVQIHGLSSPVFPTFEGGNAIKDDGCKLRCHYVHVTGPEASILMSKEHVRLLKLWQHQHQIFTTVQKTWSMDLSFLHPVTTLIITIRRQDDMNSNTNGGSTASNAIANAAQKGFFFYHGDGTNPNYDRALDHAGTSGGLGVIDGSSIATVKMKSIKLTLNGQERHPGLSDGVDVDYLQNRLLPMLHSNSNSVNKHKMGVFGAARSADPTLNGRGVYTDTNVVFPAYNGSGAINQTSATLANPQTHLDYSMQGSKNIFVYPFSLNPEGSNPSGAVNFSKVSHARLTLTLDEQSTNPGSPLHAAASGYNNGYRVDVYGLYYNWLQIKDGRALLSFA